MIDEAAANTAIQTALTNLLADQALHVDRVAIKPPPFWKADPNLWFVQLEAQFALSNISADLTKYNHVVSVIDTGILSQISDLILNPPATNKYDTIKDRLISIYSDSQDKKLKTLIADISLGDKKPSQLLNEMSRLGGSSVSNELLKSLWMQQLPAHIQAVLVTSNESLNNLALMADKVAEIEQPRSFAVQNNEPSLTDVIQKLYNEVQELKNKCYQRDRSPNTSQRRLRRSSTPPLRQPQEGDGEICWYHLHFKDRARTCKPPCRMEANQGNQTSRR